MRHMFSYNKQDEEQYRDITRCGYKIASPPEGGHLMRYLISNVNCLECIRLWEEDNKPQATAVHPNNPMQVVGQLLGILQAYAPTGTAQQRCTQFLHSMQRDGCSPDEQIRSLANSLADGLNTGNWPWVIDPEGRY